MACLMQFSAPQSAAASRPTILESPASQVAAIHTKMSLTVSVVTSGTTSYRWYKDDQLLTNSTKPSFDFASVYFPDSGKYHVVVSNHVGATVSDPAILTVVPQPRFELVGNASLPSGNSSIRMEVKDNLAFIVNDRLRIYDLSDLTNISKVSELSASVRSVAIRDNLIYGHDAEHLKVIDVGDPSKPVLVGSTPLSLGGGKTGIQLVGSNAFVQVLQGFEIFDISNSTNPVWLSSYTLANPLDIGISQNVVYIVTEMARLHLIDATNPLEPTFIKTLVLTNSVNSASKLKIAGDRLYVGGTSLAVFDISDPANPRVIGKSRKTGNESTAAIEVEGDFAYWATNGIRSGVTVFDVGAPAHLGAVQKINAENVEAISIKNELVIFASSARLQIYKWLPATNLPVPVTLIRNTAAVTNTPVCLEAYGSGGEPLQWRWFHNETLLSGETNNSLKISSANESTIGTYSVEMGNGIGWVSGGTAQLALTEAEPLGLAFASDPAGLRVQLNLSEGIQGYLEASTNLTSWGPIWSGQIGAQPPKIIDSTNSILNRFYRFRFGLE
ncbi:MAG: hypothetical protein SFY81_14770 [Verrucomicrobiota bacterium]|nr:hypothetical protein [Verrucomicrobiota bacterium]